MMQKLLLRPRLYFTNVEARKERSCAIMMGIDPSPRQDCR
jgi:hypothetical protein